MWREMNHVAGCRWHPYSYKVACGNRLALHTVEGRATVHDSGQQITIPNPNVRNKADASVKRAPLK